MRFQIAYQTVYSTYVFKGSNCIANATSKSSKRKKHGAGDEEKIEAAWHE
jgi:hypothetical protein